MQRFLPSGNTINRAYTSPTCSLEVWARRSPMSAWTSQTVVQNLRFRLRLAQGKVIKGNQSQINRIIESVIAYSDRWLAQESIDKLDHAIAIPEGANLQLSTLQLFDLYETLELCSHELVILPDLVLEVRRLSPNWLKIMAAAIALIGVSIGAVRLVSREQPSLQIASTPNPQPPEIAPPAISDRQNAAKQSEPSSPERPAASIPAPQFEPSSKPASPSMPKPSGIESKSSTPEGYSDRAIPATPNLPIGAIRRESPMTKPSAPENNSPSTLATGQATDQATSPSAAIPESRDALPGIASSRSAPSPKSPILPSAKLQITKLQITNVRSLLPEAIQNSMVSYIRDYLEPQAVSLSRNYVIEIEIAGDRIQSIAVTPTPTNISDRQVLQQLQEAIREWRSANPAKGSISIELYYSALR